MFGLGMGEIVVILVLALILLGPQRLPEAAKKLGQGLREFRKATEDLKTQFETELYQEPKPQRPTLVEPPSPPIAGAPASGAPAAAPLATPENVPGLEAALAEPAPAAAPPEPVQAASGAPAGGAQQPS